jgi:multisubunit Na+/H+ antiporter MnhF subunit
VSLIDPGPLSNVWLAAAAAVAAALAPCADMCLRGSPERRLVGMEMTSVLITLTMVLLSIGFGRSILMDIPLALAIMGFGGGLVFARFFEKHL